MPCPKHPIGGVLGCEACWEYDIRHPRENIRSRQPRPGEVFGIERYYRRGVSDKTLGRGYDEEDAPGNEEAS